MASRKGRVRPPRDASNGGSSTGGRALASDTFLTGQLVSRGAFANANPNERRPQQIQVSMGDISDFVKRDLRVVSANDSGSIAIKLLASASFNGSTTSFADIIPYKPELVTNEIVLYHSGVGILKRVASSPTSGQFLLYGTNNRSVQFGYAPESGDYVYAVFVIG